GVCAMGIAHAQTSITLTDVTIGSGLDTFTHTPNHLAVPGVNEWFLGGIGVADFPGDGWPDIFVPKGGVGADRLFRNNGNGTFTNIAASMGVAAVHAGNGVSCADYDRDGDIDLYMTSYGSGTDNLGQIGKNRLYRNDGAVFVEVAASAGLAFTSPTMSVGDGAAWGDYDLDGDLDLAVAGWSSNGVGNRLFRNDGGAFVDVTVPTLGMVASWGFQPTFVDTTGDGWPELLLAADFETSRAWRNMHGGVLAEATNEFRVGVDANGMGSCIGDFDRNGSPDYYVTSIHQTQPPAGLNGNALYLNDGSGVMSQSALAHGCDDGGWGWGAIAADLNHDGWEDIVEVNGRNAGEWAGEPEYIYRNNGAAQFTRLAAKTGFALAADARCVSTCDYDRDGDLDLVVLVNAGPLKLYRNDAVTSAGGPPWLMLDVRATTSSRVAAHGFGAVVTCTVAGETQRRFVHSGSGFHSSSEPVVHFGFPQAATVASEVRIDWPSGQTTLLTDVALRTRLSVMAPAASDLDADGQVGAGDLGLLLAEWGSTDRASRAMRRADLDHDGAVGASDLSQLLLAWGM
ncbi:MAG: FG-GAP-like repeat-containing protein, partial [bacterium]